MHGRAAGRGLVHIPQKLLCSALGRANYYGRFVTTEKYRMVIGIDLLQNITW
jgi:hypothetical protein